MGATDDNRIARTVALAGATGLTAAVVAATEAHEQRQRTAAAADLGGFTLAYVRITEKGGIEVMCPHHLEPRKLGTAYDRRPGANRGDIERARLTESEVGR
ncbi:hypothetical protein UFOVP1360_29 [uncultured Caudovirales phage]|uniref:Uncharacterized protein n=1 Tax=uncultured Caudovirales phage TaxID=2100421 RepID=A0A6J5S1Q9_9CAUD|nr:hypothetical protein UFOVP1360_29 [uncultured Caudovirales phage]